MKKTKFSLSLIIASIMLLSAIPIVTVTASDVTTANKPEMEYGELTNIADTELLKEAAELFISYGILQGKGIGADGKLIIDFDTNITRQEMAMFVGRIKSGNPAMFKYTSTSKWQPQQRFKDTSDPEFIGAINYCDDMGIIKAKDPENNLYVPEGTVTVQETVKIILTTLGYTDLSEKGCVIKSEEIGLFKGFTDSYKENLSLNLTRGEAVMFLRNFFYSDYVLIQSVFNPETKKLESSQVFEPVYVIFERNMQKADSMIQPDDGGYYYDGVRLYLNIGFEIKKYEDMNIKSIELIADDGIFAKQYIKRDNGEIITGGFPILYSGANLAIAVYGEDFDEAGKNITLDKGTVPEDVLLFLAKPISRKEFDENGFRDINMTFSAIILFNDGKKQEHNITMFPVNYFGFITPSPDEMENIKQDTKLREAFAKEVENYGFLQAYIVSKNLYDETNNIWLVTFNALIEDTEDYGQNQLTVMADGSVWILNQTLYAKILIENGEYTVTIIEKEP